MSIMSNTKTLSATKQALEAAVDRHFELKAEIDVILAQAKPLQDALAAVDLELTGTKEGARGLFQKARVEEWITARGNQLRRSQAHPTVVTDEEAFLALLPKRTVKLITKRQLVLDKIKAALSLGLISDEAKSFITTTTNAPYLQGKAADVVETEDDDEPVTGDGVPVSQAVADAVTEAAA